MEKRLQANFLPQCVGSGHSGSRPLMVTATSLIAKYGKDGVPYPHILSILGEPRIRGHFFYARMLQRTGPFLDYGCGTGDDIRQLLRDGFPRRTDHRFRSHMGEHQSRV